MKTLWEDKSDLLFRRLLLYSFLAYFLLALVIEMTPYTPKVIKRGIRQNRIVTLIEMPSKKPVSLSSHVKEREQKLAEEKKRKEEEERKRQEMEKRRAEEQRRLEEEQWKAEEKIRLQEERRLAEEKRRLEEEKRLAKERNREAAMRSGLLKAMKGEKRAVDKIVSNAEIHSAVSIPSGKLITAPPGKTGGAGPPGPPGPNAQTSVRKIVKGSEGIGDVSKTLTKEQLSGLSGQKSRTGIQTSSIKGDAAPPPFSQGAQRERSQASVKEVVNSHRGGLDFIYKKALRDNPILKGTIVIELTIAANGDVIDGHVASSTMKDPGFENQVLKRILTWKFPPYPDSGNTVVSFPIEFSPV